MDGSSIIIPMAVVILTAVFIGVGIGGATTAREVNKVKKKMDKISRSMVLSEHSLTQLEHATEKINESDEDLNAFFSMSSDMIGIADNERLLKVNTAWIEITGWSEDELTSKPWRDLIHPDDLQKTNEIVTNDLHSDNIEDFVSRIKTKKGDYVSVEWSSTRWINGKTYSIGRVVENG